MAWHRSKLFRLLAVLLGLLLAALLLAPYLLAIDPYRAPPLQQLATESARGQATAELGRRAGPGAKKPAGEKPLVEVTRIGGVSLTDVKVAAGSFWSHEKRIYPAWAAAGLNLAGGGLG